ncbi:MAG: hypothetical protein Q9159_003222 [Coniocarpon cinnabarinum]
MSSRGRGFGGRGFGGRGNRGSAFARGSGHNDGGRGRGKRPAPGDDFDDSAISADWNGLGHVLSAIDGSGYGAYKRLLQRTFTHETGFRMVIRYVQGDPYATPSRIGVVMDLDKTGLSTTMERPERVATADYNTRLAASFINKHGLDDNVAGQGGWSGPKGGALNINAPGQEILARTSCVINNAANTIELRLTVVLPAQGRTILGDKAWSIFKQGVPALVAHCLSVDRTHQHAGLQKHVQTFLDQEHMRGQLEAHGLVAFIANGSILPRQSGASSLPMASKDIVKFQAPASSSETSKSLRVELNKADSSPVIGMGVKKGVTVLTGGGFHGKSTLLAAIQQGVYNHIPGDGREYVVSDPTAFKVRAEDGRSVTSLNISPFVSTLPGGKSTKTFNTSNASGSTSMAANIQEALEIGTKLLLIDEDTAATNLLLRDERMASLIDAEPITPFVSKVRALYQRQHISTLIVVGGCGDYLSAADHVIGMQDFLPRDLTSRAQEVVASHPRLVQTLDIYGDVPSRVVALEQALVGAMPPAVRGRSFIKLQSGSKSLVKNPAEEESGIELDAVEQLVERGQLRLIAEVLFDLAAAGSSRNLKDVVLEMEKTVTSDGLDGLVKNSELWGDLVECRRFEVAAAVNRVRGLKVAV